MTKLPGPIGRAKTKALDWMEDKTPWLHRFFTSDSRLAHNGRAFAGFAVMILLATTLLWGGTGQPLGEPPVVVIESGSMMHCDDKLGTGRTGNACGSSSFGRLGTIDPGDLVFVRDIDDRGDVQVMAADGKKHHGLSGDVIVFQPDGSSSRTPVIHRAMFWIDIHDDDTYSIPALGLHRIGPEDFEHPNIVDRDRFGLSAGCDLSLSPVLGPEDSGFITKGDNNNCWDQSGGRHAVASRPIQPDWILGKARGEVPWIGMLKLWSFDLFGPSDNYAKAPSDLKVAMWISVGVLLGAPYGIEFALKRRRNREPTDDELLADDDF